MAIELEYAKSMFDQHKKAHPNDEIVGWLVAYLYNPLIVIDSTGKRTRVMIWPLP